MNQWNKDRTASAFLKRGVIALLFLLLLALAGGGYAFFFAGEKKSVPDKNREPPVVKAEAIKSTPAEPGGMKIPHQDKLIFRRLTAEETKDSEDVVMGPGAEEPLLFGASKSNVLDMPITGPDATVPNVRGAYVAQLASFAKRLEAETGMEKLQTRFPDFLAPLTVIIQSADLGKRGVWHRLHVGYFNTRSQAQDVCQMFKERGLDCLVTVR